MKTREDFRKDLTTAKKAQLLSMAKEYGLKVSKSDTKHLLLNYLSEAMFVESERIRFVDAFKNCTSSRELERVLNTSTAHALWNFARKELGIVGIGFQGLAKDKIVRKILERRD